MRSCAGNAFAAFHYLPWVCALYSTWGKFWSGDADATRDVVADEAPAVEEAAPSNAPTSIESCSSDED